MRAHIISCVFVSTCSVSGPVPGRLMRKTPLTLTPSLQACGDAIIPEGTDGETEAQKGFCDQLKVTQLVTKTGTQTEADPQSRLTSSWGRAGSLAASPGRSAYGPKSLPRVLRTEVAASFPVTFALPIKNKTRKKTCSLKQLDINTHCY